MLSSGAARISKEGAETLWESTYRGQEGKWGEGTGAWKRGYCPCPPPATLNRGTDTEEV